MSSKSAIFFKIYLALNNIAVASLMLLFVVSRQVILNVVRIAVLWMRVVLLSL